MINKAFYGIKSDAGMFLLMSLPALLLFTAFFVIPSLSGIYYAFTDWDGLSRTYNIIWFDNFLMIFSDTRLQNALRFTLLYTIIIVASTIVLSLGIAILLNMNIKFRAFFRSVYFFPSVLSLITVGLIFSQIYFIPLPMIGQALGIPWLSTNILGNPRLAIAGILITNLWQGLAMPTVIFLAGLQSVPGTLYEAATIDGAGVFAKFKHVTLPFLIPILNVNLVLAVRGGLTVFDYIMAMTNGGPGFATESIGILIYNQGFNQFRFGYGAAMSIMLLTIIAVISIIQVNLLNRKEAGQQ